MLMRSAAGGETGAPRSQRGTRLKATTERAFLVVPAPMPEDRKGLSIFASSAERDLPHPDQGSNRRDAVGLAIGGPHASQEVHLRRPAPPFRTGELGEMTARIREFLKRRKDEGPCLVVDLDVVRENYFACTTRKKCYFSFAQFRTCLWPCVGRWASGQEAGQPPKGENSLPCSCDRQPEAKPAHLVLNGGRGLKQRRSGLFWQSRRECRTD